MLMKMFEAVCCYVASITAELEIKRKLLM